MKELWKKRYPLPLNHSAKVSRKIYQHILPMCVTYASMKNQITHILEHYLRIYSPEADLN